VVIATKVNGPMGADANNRGLSRKHIMDGIDRSLTRLGVDYVDLYQIHRFDHDTPIEETLEALNDVVRAGKARYIGASSMYAWQFMKMLSASRAHGWTPFASMQPQYNLVYREEEREMLPLCEDQGIGVIPWSPLARGFLAGGRANPGEGNTERARTDEFAPRLYYREPDFAVVDAVETIAKARGVSNMQIALAWVLKNPTITAPIIGTSKAHHLTDALAALEFKLDADEIASLERPYKPKPVLDHA
jgi:aryl-alcohol dehydrogenase-like predicted oxidoreductase